MKRTFRDDDFERTDNPLDYRQEWYKPGKYSKDFEPVPSANIRFNPKTDTMRSCLCPKEK